MSQTTSHVLITWLCGISMHHTDLLFKCGCNDRLWGSKGLYPLCYIFAAYESIVLNIQYPFLIKYLTWHLGYGNKLWIEPQHWSVLSAWYEQDDSHHHCLGWWWWHDHVPQNMIHSWQTCYLQSRQRMFLYFNIFTSILQSYMNWNWNYT